MVTREIQAKVAASGATLIEQRKPQTNLERYFLQVTGDEK